RFDKLSRPANGIQVNKAWPTWYENKISGLGCGECLRPGCGWRVDDNQFKLALLCRLQAIRQSSLGQKLHMGRAAFSAVSPNGRAFLLVEIKKSCLIACRHGEVDSDSGFADSALLGNQGYGFHNCSPSIVHCF